MKASDYDTIFFESFANPERHIDRLFSQLRLRGVTPKPPSQSRTLEIGCSTGVNLIPQAILYPNSEFVGVDLSEGQIAEAQRIVAALNLTNITFEACGIERLNCESKSFDYVICHGLYSWVESAMQHTLLDRIARFLSPKGVAYLSYNTAIGWKGSALLKKLFADIHGGELDVREKVRALRGLVNSALVQFQSSVSISQSKVFQFLTYLNTVSDALLLHEYLNPHASGTSVAELSRALGKYRLQYFGDARPQRDGTHPSAPKSYPKALVHGLDRALQEDLNDLFNPKSFRSALIVHDSIGEHPISSGDQILDLHFASPLIELSQGIEDDEFLFMLGEEQPCQIRERPIISIVHDLIANWPAPVSGTNINLQQLTIEHLNIFIELISTGAIQVSHGAFGCAHKLTDKPNTSPFIRLKARSGRPLITLKHEFFNANVFERALLGLLDGSHTIEQLAELMSQMFQSGELTLSGNQSTEISTDFFIATVEMALGEFLEHGLLLK